MENPGAPQEIERKETYIYTERKGIMVGKTTIR